ncbi:MAG: translocation/assembly module TamB domain-containing protein, partial [Pseudomonadota bacterium]
MKSFARFATAADVLLKALAVAILAVAVSAGLALLLVNTGPGREQLRGVLERRLSGFVAGKVSVGRVERAVPSSIVLRDVVVRDEQGARLARIDVVRVSIDVLALASRTVRLKAAYLLSPSIEIRIDEQGNTDLSGVGVEPDTSEPDASPWKVRLDSLRVRQGAVTILGSHGQLAAFEEIELSGEGHASADKAAFLLASAKGIWVERDAELWLAGQVVREGPAIVLSEVQLALAGSEVRIPRASVETPTGVVSAALAVHARAEEIRALIAADRYPAAQGWRADVLLEGTVERESGEAAGWKTSFRGTLGGAAASIDATVEPGVRAVNGSIGLENLDPSRVVADLPEGELDVSAAYSLQGRSLDTVQGQIDGQASGRLAGRSGVLSSRWDAAAGAIRTQAELTLDDSHASGTASWLAREGVLTFDSARLRVRTRRPGELLPAGFPLEGDGEVEIVIESVGTGTGTGTGTGKAVSRGFASNGLTVRGAVKASDLAVGAARFERLKASCAFAGIGGNGELEGTVVLQADGLALWDRCKADAESPRRRCRGQRIGNVSLRARLSRAGRRVDFSLTAGSRSSVCSSRISIDGKWSTRSVQASFVASVAGGNRSPLSAPVLSGTAPVRGTLALKLGYGPRRELGELERDRRSRWLRAPVEARLVAEGFSLAILNRIGLVESPLRGSVDASVSVSGTVSRPAVSFEALATDARIGPTRFEEVALDGQMDSRWLAAAARIRQSTGGTLVVSLEMPRPSAMRGSARSWGGRIVADKFDLAWLSTLARHSQYLAGVAGTLDADVRLDRTGQLWQGQGTALLRHGRFAFGEGPTVLEDIELRARFVEQQLMIDRLVGHSRGGSFSVVGLANMAGLRPDSVRLDVEIRSLPIAVGSNAAAATLDGEIVGRLVGRLDRSSGGHPDSSRARRLHSSTDKGLSGFQGSWQIDATVRSGLIELPRERRRDLQRVGPLEDYVFLDERSGAGRAQPNTAQRRTSAVAGAATSVPVEGRVRGEEPLARINLRTANRIGVRGREVDALVDAHLRAVVLPDRTRTAIYGEVFLVRGGIELAERRWELVHGRASFAGESPPDPDLEVLLRHEFR